MMELQDVTKIYQQGRRAVQAVRGVSLHIDAAELGTGSRCAVPTAWAVGVLTLVSVGLATLGGLGPALHAFRLRMPEAIAYE